jgi:hypothetical protein
MKGSTRKQFTNVDLTNRAAPVTITGEGGEITRSRKWEGAWWENGRAYIVCSFARTTEAGDWSLGAHDGQVWSYDPARSTLRLEVFFPLNRPVGRDRRPTGRARQHHGEPVGRLVPR